MDAPMKIFFLNHRENHGSIGKPAALPARRQYFLRALGFPAQAAHWRRRREKWGKAVILAALLGFLGSQVLGCAAQTSPALIPEDLATPPVFLPKEGYVSKKTVSKASGRQQALVYVEGVTVFVGPLSRGTERLGLNREQIKVDVEYQLKKAGLRVLTEQESFKTQGKAFLYVNLNTIFWEEVCSYSVQVQLMEMVKLVRGPVTVGSIWNTNLLGVIGIANIATIRVRIGEQIEEFIKAFPPVPIGDKMLDGVKVKPSPKK
jgi:hypothetical protein